MNTPISSTHELAFSPFDRVVRDDEKKHIMEKVYNSEVFQEFVRQWGVAMTFEQE